MTQQQPLTKAPETAIAASQKSFTEEEIQNWLIENLSSLLGLDTEEIDPSAPFERFGLDSSTAVGLTSELEEWLGCEVDPTLLYDYPTIESQAAYLATGAS